MTIATQINSCEERSSEEPKEDKVALNTWHVNAAFPSPHILVASPMIYPAATTTMLFSSSCF
jgi:hypothetical protein